MIVTWKNGSSNIRKKKGKMNTNTLLWLWLKKSTKSTTYKSLQKFFKIQIEYALSESYIYMNQAQKLI